MPDPNTLISKVLPLCEPTRSQERRIAKIAKEAKAHVDSYVARLDGVVDVVFGGSFAKGTWLPDHADIDIFVKIKSTVEIENSRRWAGRLAAKH